MFLNAKCLCVQNAACLLDAEAEVEQAVRGVRLSVRSFHLSDEAAEAVAQLSCGAFKDILL